MMLNPSFMGIPARENFSQMCRFSVGLLAAPITKFGQLCSVILCPDIADHPLKCAFTETLSRACGFSELLIDQVVCVHDRLLGHPEKIGISAFSTNGVHGRSLRLWWWVPWRDIQGAVHPGSLRSPERSNHIQLGIFFASFRHHLVVLGVHSNNVINLMQIKCQ